MPIFWIDRKTIQVKVRIYVHCVSISGNRPDIPDPYESKAKLISLEFF